MIPVIFFVVYHGINIFLGWWNAAIVQRRIDSGNKKQIEHFYWALMYAALCVPWYWAFGPWYVLALGLLHLSIFGPAYNAYRGIYRFNLSKTTTSAIDRTLLKMGFKTLEWPCIIAEG